VLIAFLAGWMAISMWVGPKMFGRRDLLQASAGTRVREPVTWRQAAVIGVFMWAGYLLVLAALSIAPLSVVAPVRESAIVAVAVWGVWKLRERKGAPLKLLGASATLVGVLLLAL
jgi:drug/metabolite transporter (DMT)-like permease